MTDTAAPATRRFGAQSMTAPLREVLVKRPGAAFGAAYDNPAHGFLHPVDLAEAQRQHDAFCTILADLGVAVHQLDAETASPDLVYTFDPALVTDRGVIAPAVGQADPPGRGGRRSLDVGRRRTTSRCSAGSRRRETADGGDTFWLRPDVFCIGRSLRTNAAGAAPPDRARRRRRARLRRPLRQRPGRVPAPALGDLADRRRPGRRLPAPAPRRAVRAARRARASTLVPVPEEEIVTQGCNILAVRPGVVVMVEGNPVDAAGAARPRLRGAHVPRRPRCASTAPAARPASPARSCADEEPDPGRAGRRRERRPRPHRRRPGGARRDPEPDRRRGRGADRGGAADDDGRARRRAGRHARDRPGGRPRLPRRRGARARRTRS